MASSPVFGLGLRPLLQVKRSQLPNVGWAVYSSMAGPSPGEADQANSPPGAPKQELPTWAKPISCQSPPSDTRKSRKPTGMAKLDAYLELAKPRLTALVVLSAMSSYALAPDGGSLTSLAVLSAGTALCSASANAINQGREPVYDRMMTRTRNRPVASYRLTSRQAFEFATLTGITGVTLLGLGTNWIVALLGAANIALYGGLYTSLKRKSITNTWVGAVVGAIPPLMGWATRSTLLAPGPWVLAGLLYSWQFPHFMSLSYSIAEEYKNAGYVMSAWTNPLLTARVALRHAIVMFPLCIAASYVGLTDPYFIIDSSVVNGWQAYAAWKFYKQQRSYRGQNPAVYMKSGDHKKYARRLFWASVIHLPLILLLAMLHKKGRWDWLFGQPADNSASGAPATNVNQYEYGHISHDSTKSMKPANDDEKQTIY